MPVTVSPLKKADKAWGNDTNAMRTNRYAAHMLPTARVTMTATASLNRPMAFVPFIRARTSRLVT